MHTYWFLCLVFCLLVCDINESHLLSTKYVKMEKRNLMENMCFICCCSIAYSWPTLQPHGLQHARLPCPSPPPGACSNSCLLRQRCHPTISSSAIPFSSCLRSFPASGKDWVVSLHQVAEVLELQLQHQSFQCIFRIDFL